jgi:hypothetical protein
MPDCNINLQQSIHGDSVIYRVAPSQLCVDLATLVIAFVSACKTYHFVLYSLNEPSGFNITSSHSFSKPDGVPLYP